LRLQKGRRRISFEKDRALAAMTPTRVPVKEPGPVPMAMKSMEVFSRSFSIAGRSACDCLRGGRCSIIKLSPLDRATKL